MEKYTTAEKILALKDDVKEQDEEKKKTIITNDAYAIVDLLEELKKKIEHTRLSLI